MNFSACATYKTLLSYFEATNVATIVSGGLWCLLQRKLVQILLVVSSGTVGYDISTATYLNIAGTTTDGADSSGETLVEAMTRAKEFARFTGVISNLAMEDSCCNICI